MIAPHERHSITGRAEVEGALRAMLDAGSLSHGWLIAGPKGAGKATLAYRVARALLDPGSLGPTGLDMAPDARGFRLIAARGHPDLFVAEKQFDEKNDRYASEITVETIRELSAFLSKTASQGGWRVAIVDTADELNRNAANALLKSLEEPPQKSVILLLADQVGRLLPTIRSRCRRIDLKPVPNDEVVGLLMSEVGLDGVAARAVAGIAKGRPGHALTLAAGEGTEAAALAEEFLKLSLAGRDGGVMSAAFSGKAGAGKFEVFVEILLQNISDAARAAARGGGKALGAVAPGELVDAYARMRALASRGEALNVDRGQILFALSRELRSACG
jgi:DNA polymerase-3 subunit delta'